MAERVAAGLQPSSRRLGSRAFLRVGAVGGELFFGGHESAPTPRCFCPDRDRCGARLPCGAGGGRFRG
jgi:hypothetical protein